MTTFTEVAHAAEFIQMEQLAGFSRKTVTLLTGQDLKAGSVLGKITSGGKYKLTTIAASDGSEVPSAILIYPTNTSSTGPLGAGDQTVVVLARGPAVVNKNLLTWGADIDQDSEKVTAIAALLAASNIEAR